MNERWYLLKIQLLDVKPAIWRRFVVPSTITLDRLHDVVQIVMGWMDCHLHEFTIGKKRFTEEPEESRDGLPEERYRLINLIKQKGRSFRYLYDFGDGWEHELVLEDSHFLDMEFQVDLACLDGARSCPPEDVGGPFRYPIFCDALADPSHPEHQHYFEWFGGGFDSEQFDVNLVNWQLMNYVRWSRDRYQNWGSVE